MDELQDAYQLALQLRELLDQQSKTTPELQLCADYANKLTIELGRLWSWAEVVEIKPFKNFDSDDVAIKRTGP